MEQEQLERLRAALQDHYTIERELGRGGAAVVFLARDRKHGRSVALKVLLPRVGMAVGAERFQREIKIAARLSHPHILPLHDSGEAAGLLYYVMPFMRGESLRDRLTREGQLPIADAVRICTEVSSALDRAHQDNIVHRDIKPENILIEGGFAVVADFGIAHVKSAVDDAAITQSGVSLGTPMYMSPEQAIGSGEINGRSDLYSLGCVLFEMLSGAPPFKGATMRETLIRHSVAEVPDVHSFRADVPPHLDRVLRKVMAKDPVDRFATGAELTQALADPTFGFATPTSSGRVQTSAAGQGLWGRLRQAFGLRDSPSPVAPSGVRTEVAAPERRTEAVPARNNTSVELERAKALNIAVSATHRAMVAPLVTTPSGRVPIDSVAVLPFSSAGGDADGEYLAEGITESIMHKLSGVAGLRVVPRSVVFRYRTSESDPLLVARAVGARAIVTGRIVQRGDMLVIRTEMVDSVTEAQLWGEQFNRRITDIFAVQEEMAAEITRSLRLKLSGDEAAGLTKRFTEDPQAYQAYLRGRHYWSKRTVDGLRRSLTHFQDAIDLDPSYALAHDGLADTYNILGYYNTHRPHESFPRGKIAAARALALDPTLAEAHASMGYVKLFYDFDWAGARESLERAMQLGPQYATGHQWYAWYLFVVERHDEALVVLRHAQSLDPLSLIINDHLGYALLLAGKPKEALVQLLATKELDVAFPWTYWRLGSVYLELGRFDESIAAFDTVVSLTDAGVGLGYKGLALGMAGRPDEARGVLTRLATLQETRYVSPLEYALVHAGLGDLDAALTALELAYADRVSDVARVKALPWPTAMRADARFGALLQRLGLAS